MNVEELTPEALRLPARDRASLAASLWESLEDPYAVFPDVDEEAALSLARQRDEEMESGAVKPLSHSELMAQQDTQIYANADSVTLRQRAVY